MGIQYMELRFSVSVIFLQINMAGASVYLTTLSLVCSLFLKAELLKGEEKFIVAIDKEQSCHDCFFPKDIHLCFEHMRWGRHLLMHATHSYSCDDMASSQSPYHSLICFPPICTEATYMLLRKPFFLSFELFLLSFAMWDVVRE